MLVVIALVMMISLGTIYSLMDSFGGYSYHGDRDVLLSALQHARAESMADICRGSSCTIGKSYGVAIRPSDHPSSYVIFQTETASPTYQGRSIEDQNQDIMLDASTNTARDEVVFNSGTGNITSGTKNFVVTDSHRTSTITVTKYGTISWTN